MTEELLTKLFLKVVNMSVSAGWLVLAVLALRALLRKAPKWTAPALWAIVGLRLVMPFSIESVLSLIPSAETVSPEIIYAQHPAIDSGVPIINQAVNPVIAQSFTPNPSYSANPLQIWLFVAACVWAAGAVGMLLYTLGSWLVLKRRVGTAVLLRDNLYQSEAVASPFVLGVVRPKIYLPFSLAEGELDHVVAHERAHIARRDHWWKPLGFLLLAVHWFNPLLWIAYVLLCRDIELACDERVIQTLDPALRADYSQALLECSVPRRMISACPLAFGEMGVKERVKRVLSYKKPALWLTCVAVAVCAAVAVCFLTDPVQAETPEPGPVVWRDEANSEDFPYELHLPESWRDKFTAIASLRWDEEGSITHYWVEFFQTQKSAPDLSGLVCTLSILPDEGQTEAEILPPVPSVYLGRGGGWIYFLYFASDVQVDPADRSLAQEYQTMYQDALTQMGPDRFVLRLDSTGPVEIESVTWAGLQGAGMPNTFLFCSGAGAWSTQLAVKSDGTFSGHFEDGEMGDADPQKYPNGTAYVCDFVGTFSQPVRVDDYTCSARVERLEIQPQEEVVTGGVRYLPSTPYGMEDADEVLIYLPGKPAAEISEEAMGWLRGPADWSGDALPFHALVNVNEQQAFCAWTPALSAVGEPETTGFNAISWTTPAGLTETAYNILYGQAGGVLFQPDAYRAAEAYTPPDWYAAGSVCEYYTSGIIQWDGNEIGDVFSYSNHSILEELRPLEGLCAPAFLARESHDLYTAADLGKMEEAGTDLDTVELTSNYWCVYFARPGAEKGVVVTLNAKNFSEADILALAQSVRY